MKANIINNKMKGGKNKMRNISKIALLCIFTVVLMQVSAIAFAADISYNNDQNNTTQEQIENIQSTDNNTDTENELQPMMAAPCDQYGSTQWSSLSDAQKYYGTDFTYTYCGGYPYNYYYTFSDGSRMYFGVW